MAIGSGRLTMIVGRDDQIAPASLSESYQVKAVQLGKRVRLVPLDGRDHEIFLDPAVFNELARVLEDRQLVLNA